MYYSVLELHSISPMCVFVSQGKKKKKKTKIDMSMTNIKWSQKYIYTCSFYYYNIKLKL